VDALLKQTTPASEIVITDGGSTDGTWTLLQKFARRIPKLRVYQIRGNRSIGRNFAVSKTTSPIIAITDAGCKPDPTWLAEIVKPFSNPQTQVVSGFYRGFAATVFEYCLIPYILVMPDRVNPLEFFPSSRSMAISRTAWNKSGGFNPLIDPSEDFELAHYLKKLGYRFTFAPRAQVVWYPKQTLSEAAWMFLRFAYGDIQAGIIRPKIKLLAVRYLLFTYLCFVAAYFPSLIFPLLFAMLGYLFWAVAKNYKYVNAPQAIFWLPVLQITADICVLFGSLMSLLSFSKKTTRL
jgi:cellulose synthase/poly-beta-1,6-N-acetylglucosamine synthase-like glycosyltransferase